MKQDKYFFGTAFKENKYVQIFLFSYAQSLLGDNRNVKNIISTIKSNLDNSLKGKDDKILGYP